MPRDTPRRADEPRELERRRDPAPRPEREEPREEPRRRPRAGTRERRERREPRTRAPERATEPPMPGQRHEREHERAAELLDFHEEREVAGEAERPARPNLDVHDNPEDVTVTVDLPGFDREQVEVSASDRRLRVRAERPEAEAEAEGRLDRRERAPRVERTLELPARAEADEARAEFENGVLRVELPKQEQERERPVDIERPEARETPETPEE